MGACHASDASGQNIATRIATRTLAQAVSPTETSFLYAPFIFALYVDDLNSTDHASDTEQAFESIDNAQSGRVSFPSISVSAKRFIPFMLWPPGWVELLR
jgi:hypothetical protein